MAHPSSPTEALEAEELAQHLSALSFRNRLVLLAQLREPKTIDELQLHPAAPDNRGSKDRSLTREGVRHHLEKLVEAGLVRTGSAGGPGNPSTYVLDEAGVYRVIEELGRLVLPGSPVDLEPLKTQGPLEPETGVWPAPPRLVLVHGARPGQAFRLCPPAGQEPGRGWTIGRSPEAHISLPYDPYASSMNTEVVPAEEGGYEVIDLRTSTNGTRVNGERLPVGGRRELVHGDVLQVGVSLLVLQVR